MILWRRLLVTLLLLATALLTPLLADRGSPTARSAPSTAPAAPAAAPIEPAR